MRKSATTIVLDMSGLVDEEGRATHAETERALYAVHLDDEPLGVRQQGEGELVLVAERAMALRALRADARDFEPGRIELRMQVPDLASLASTSRREIGGVEIEDQRPIAQQIAERGHLAVRVRQGEFGCPSADCQHGELQGGLASAHDNGAAGSGGKCG